MTQQELLSLLPHRAPFLFVDEVIEVDAKAIKTIFRADPALPFFAGHFPTAPIMPGVLLCECCLQAGAVLMGFRNACIRTAHASEGQVPARASAPCAVGMAAQTVPVVTRILEAKFKRAVQPGDVLNVDVSLDEELGGAFFMTGKVTLGGDLALRSRFAVTEVPTHGA